MTRVGFVALVASAVLFGIAGCSGSSYESIDGPGAPRLTIWPEKGDSVSRNASVFADVRPTSARVTGFELTETYNGQSWPIGVSSKKRTYANQYLFCPNELLAAWSHYEVWMEVDGQYRYRWTFSTNSSVTGSPGDCYYIDPTASGLSVVSPGTLKADPFLPVTIPGLSPAAN